MACGCPGPSSPCTNPPSSCPSQVPSYQGEINAIIVGGCLPCHDPTTGQDQPPALNGYTAVAAGAGSSLDQLAACKMPTADSGFVLTAQQRQDLLTWYVCGAPNN